MKVIVSFSGGKDSLLALYRAQQAGHEVLALVTTWEPAATVSNFHRLPQAFLEAQAKSLGLPLRLVDTSKNYNEAFEEELKYWQRAGAQGCVFGDIDLIEHRQWDEERCAKAQLESLFPLWQEARGDLVSEFIHQGFQGWITVVNEKKMPGEFLGQILTQEVVQDLVSRGIDPCGEAGEYHSVVLNGPNFLNAIERPPVCIKKLDSYAYLHFTEAL